MERSPENYLPEAHSLPDGFVETLAEPPPSTAAAADYKDALLDLEPSIEFDRPAPSRSSAEILKLDPLADGLDKLAVSADSSAQERILSARDDPPERSAETSTKDSSSSEGKSQVGSKISERESILRLVGMSSRPDLDHAELSLFARGLSHFVGSCNVKTKYFWMNAKEYRQRGRI